MYLIRISHSRIYFTYTASCRYVITTQNQCSWVLIACGFSKTPPTPIITILLIFNNQLYYRHIKVYRFKQNEYAIFLMLKLSTDLRVCDEVAYTVDLFNLKYRPTLIKYSLYFNLKYYMLLSRRRQGQQFRFSRN